MVLIQYRWFLATCTLKMSGTINEHLCQGIEALPNDVINVLGGVNEMLGDQSLIINMGNKDSKHNF